MIEVEKAIGRIYAQMGEYNISALSLAKASGVTRVTLSNWRHGKSTPSLDKFLTVQFALDSLVAEKRNQTGAVNVQAE